jgi:hypothetical protein
LSDLSFPQRFLRIVDKTEHLGVPMNDISGKWLVCSPGLIHKPGKIYFHFDSSFRTLYKKFLARFAFPGLNRFHRQGNIYFR